MKSRFVPNNEIVLDLNDQKRREAYIKSAADGGMMSIHPERVLVIGATPFPPPKKLYE